jgi:hypothetical protein
VEVVIVCGYIHDFRKSEGEPNTLGYLFLFVLFFVFYISHSIAVKASHAFSEVFEDRLLGSVALDIEHELYASFPSGFPDNVLAFPVVKGAG